MNKYIINKKRTAFTLLIFSVLFMLLMTACSDVEHDKRGKEDQSEKLLYAILEVDDYQFKAGNLQAVKEVLREDKNIDLEELKESKATDFSENERRALAIAIYYNNSEEIITELIKAGADVNSIGERGETYLEQVVYNETIFDMLLEAGADATAEEYGSNIAFEALAEDASPEKSDIFYDHAKKLLSHGAKITKGTLAASIENPNGYRFSEYFLSSIEKEKGETGISEELTAAIKGDNASLQKAIRSNKINKKYEATTVLYAAANCSPQTLKMLYDKGYDFEVSDFEGKNPLHVAARYNDADAVECLIDIETLNAKKDVDFEGINALTYAAASGNEDIVKLLQKSGVKWQYSDEGYSTWVYACQSGDENAITLLLKEGYKPTKSNIVYGCEECTDSAFSEMVQNDISFDVTFDEMTPLEQLCCFDEEKALELYNQGTEVTDDAIGAAISVGFDGLAKTLIGDSKDPQRISTALSAAIKEGNLELVEYFVENGAEINYLFTPKEGEPGDKRTVMHIAAESPSDDIYRYLIEHGGDTEIKDSDGNNSKR